MCFCVVIICPSVDESVDFWWRNEFKSKVKNCQRHKKMRQVEKHYIPDLWIEGSLSPWYIETFEGGDSWCRCWFPFVLLLPSVLEIRLRWSASLILRMASLDTPGVWRTIWSCSGACTGKPAECGLDEGMEEGEGISSREFPLLSPLQWIKTWATARPFMSACIDWKCAISAWERLEIQEKHWTRMSGYYGLKQRIRESAVL